MTTAAFNEKSTPDLLERAGIPIIAGSVAGCLEICITYPLEFAKNSMQVQPGRFASFCHAMYFNVAKDGPFVLYRGLNIWLIFAAPRNVVRFGIFENVISLFDDRRSLGAQVVSGMLAGAIEAPTCLVPMQNVSIKMTHDANKLSAQQRYPSFFRGLMLIARESGFRGLVLNGLPPTLLKNIINYSIRFPTFLTLKEVALSWKNDRNYKDKNSSFDDLPLDFAETMICGSVAGGLSSIVSHPADVVKAQMMGLEGHKFRGSNIGCAQHLWRTKGFRGFYIGPQMYFYYVFVVSKKRLDSKIYVSNDLTRFNSKAYQSLHRGAYNAPFYVC